MHAWGLLLFVLAVPAAVLGICDPNAKRGSVLTVAAALMGPFGLLVATT